MFEAGRGRDTEVMTVRQRKGFVKIALETGVPIVPCYCFGNTQIFDTPHAATSGATDTALARLSRYLRTSLVVFWGRFGLPIPFRVPLLTVIGRPIPCPKVDAPSPELVNEYHDVYLRETKRIYDKYRNCYGWDDRPLVFKR
jgi:2-acylglycerol O-acyltransferase 2